MTWKNAVTTSFIVVANLTPLIGLTFSDWMFSVALWAYWIETLVVGIFIVLKVKKVSREHSVRDESKWAIQMLLGSLLISGFFASTLELSTSLRTLLFSLALPAVAFFVSNWLIFKINFLSEHEERVLKTTREMLRPLFGRTLLFFVILYVALEYPNLIALVAIKTFFEVVFYLRTRTRMWLLGRAKYGENWH